MRKMYVIVNVYCPCTNQYTKWLDFSIKCSYFPYIFITWFNLYGWNIILIIARGPDFMQFYFIIILGLLYKDVIIKTGQERCSPECQVFAIWLVQLKNQIKNYTMWRVFLIQNHIIMIIFKLQQLSLVNSTFNYGGSAYSTFVLKSEYSGTSYKDTLEIE